MAERSQQNNFIPNFTKGMPNRNGESVEIHPEYLKSWELT